MTHINIRVLNHKIQLQVGEEVLQKMTMLKTLWHRFSLKKKEPKINWGDLKSININEITNKEDCIRLVTGAVDELPNYSYSVEKMF